MPLPKEYGGIKTGFTLVLLLQPGKLYLLSFRIDSRAAADAKRLRVDREPVPLLPRQGQLHSLTARAEGRVAAPSVRSRAAA